MAEDKDKKEKTQAPVVAQCEPEPVPTPVEEKALLLKKIGEILALHAGLESNIPINHEYWNLLNRFRGL